MNQTPIVVKHSTLEKYQRTFNLLVSRYRQDRFIQETNQIDWVDFVGWMIADATSRRLSPSYTQVLRSCSIYFLSGMNQANSALAAEYASRWDFHSKANEIHGEDESPAVVNARGRRPSKRMIPREDWSLLINHFNKSRSESARRAQMMIAAGVGCGARPIEWLNAKLVSENVIRIFTSKVKNSNAWDRVAPGVFTEFRDENLFIEGAPDDAAQDWDLILFEDRVQRSGLDAMMDRELIEELRVSRDGVGTRIFRDVVFEDEFKIPIKANLRNIEEFFRGRYGDDWRSMDAERLEQIYTKNYYQSVRMAVFRACKTLFRGEKIYSPADTRSTFAANRKAKMGLRQASADLGHTSTAMTKAHYAGARDAWDT